MKAVRVLYPLRRSTWSILQSILCMVAQRLGEDSSASSGVGSWSCMAAKALESRSRLHQKNLLVMRWRILLVMQSSSLCNMSFCCEREAGEPFTGPSVLR